MATKASDIVKKHLLTVDEYHRMGEIGILKQQDRVELIEGEIIDMAPVGSNHAGTVLRLSKALNKILQEKADVYVQSPIVLNNINEPEPDIALLKPRDDDYRHSLPKPEDILLIIEVAESSLQYDCEIKIPLYAKHGIPEVWLVDLANNQLTTYTCPKHNKYENIQTTTNYSEITLLEIPGIKLNLSKLFE
jgi:Uma2 family endonuclease